MKSPMTASIFKGRLSAKEIDKKPQDFKGSEADAWVQELLEQSAPEAALIGLQPKEWAEKSRLNTEVHLEKVGTDYMVRGQLSANVPTACSRCGDVYSVDREANFQVFLVPTDPRAPEPEPSDDPDYIFMKSDTVDLCALVSEQLVVQEPVAECPQRKSDGSCTLCGKNPQYTGRQELADAATSPFAKLKVLKE